MRLCWRHAESVRWEQETKSLRVETRRDMHRNIHQNIIHAMHISGQCREEGKNQRHAQNGRNKVARVELGNANVRNSDVVDVRRTPESSGCVSKYCCFDKM
jgi:DUF971 family protein